jgi:FkbM family methyltransferase
MDPLKSLMKIAFNCIPADIELLLKFSQRYLDRHNGDNNSDQETNGEEYLLRTVFPSNKNGMVFDVGANVGNWTKFALSVESTLNIHMFEPSLATYNLNLQTVWPQNVKLNHMGLGEREETLQLHVVDTASGMNSLYCRQGVESATPTSTESIRITTLDGYCDIHNIEHIDFMKIDVEGHELSVLRGGRRMLEEGRIDMIQFEYGGCNLDARVYLSDIWEYLSQNKYCFAKLFPEGPRPIEQYSQHLENFRYSNFIAYLDKQLFVN